MDATSTQNYITILEKTNEQLSFWYLPYEVGIGFLTAAVAVLTIGFSVLLWRQNVNYRDLINKFIQERKKNVEDSFNMQFKEGVRKIEEMGAKTSGDLRKELDIIISTLRQNIATPQIEELSLAERKTQSILSLLQSFGADPETIKNAENVLRGNQPLPYGRTTTLTETEKDSIVALLQSFGTDSTTISNIRKVLSIR